ncbi:SDR family oxidoreductase [Oleiagrimonas sp. C23AA]|uniref:SDR family oxidoreductase n=1 Tax=Oleiagrimonas sp. C23AA TaxID=2719047 RepID=UPI00141E45A1|nr:SDR family oxidoreductase [Oleiagrimonas sp. C23AA]NII09239.1 SDR family oxidoreductase [Oleiagrimonas sp. C23AA]
MQLDLSHKHALVCGASQGIGRATAMELAALGADVTVLARSHDALNALVQVLPRTHQTQTHRALVADMLDTDVLAERVDDLAGHHPVQILVGNSGGPPAGAVHSADPEAFEAAFRQHLIAAQVMQQALVPGMRAARYGRIVNIISTSVKEPIAGLGVSNTVRAAVASWAKTLAGELAADGITVNNVLPGYTRTARLEGLIKARSESGGKSREQVEAGMLAQVPAARFAEPEEVASVAAFLCTPAAGYVNGTSLAVDGGRTRSLS